MALPCYLIQKFSGQALREINDETVELHRPIRRGVGPPQRQGAESLFQLLICSWLLSNLSLLHHSAPLPRCTFVKPLDFIHVCVAEVAAITKMTLARVEVATMGSKGWLYNHRLRSSSNEERKFTAMSRRTRRRIFLRAPRTRRVTGSAMPAVRATVDTTGLRSCILPALAHYSAIRPVSTDHFALQPGKSE